MTPYYQDDWVTLYCSDCVEVLTELGGVSAVVTDPPYHLTEISIDGRRRHPNANTPFDRYKVGDKGFMGQSWDGGGISFNPAMWRLVRDCCLPGAHMLAFGGTRTFHRIACAIEDAGWEIRDCLMFLFGAGLPKSLNVGKELPQFSGYGTALKPAFEPITLARKPLGGTVAENAIAHGCGALNIDGCRVESKGEQIIEPTPSAKAGNAGWDRPWRSNQEAVEAFNKRKLESLAKTRELGRWPANVIHDGSPEVLAGFPESTSVHSPHASGEQGIWNNGSVAKPIQDFHDSGSAARFFYTAKASGEERVNNPHPTVKPLALIQYLCQLVQQPERNLVLDPFAGSGTTLVACKALNMKVIGVERSEEYCAIAVKRLTQEVLPFVKPEPLYHELINNHFREADIEAAEQFVLEMEA